MPAWRLVECSPRIDMPEVWVLVRSSVTEPALTFRCESRDGAALENLVQRVCGAATELRDQLERIPHE